MFLDLIKGKNQSEVPSILYVPSMDNYFEADLPAHFSNHLGFDSTAMRQGERGKRESGNSLDIPLAE
jgi:hypothetical protein